MEICDNNTALIVDDDKLGGYLIQSLLRKRNISSIISDNAFQAIKLFDNNPQINMVFLDFFMPEVRGDELLSLLREKNPDINYAFISGLQYSECPEFYTEISQDRFITKPVTIKKINEVIDSFIQK